ncbi:MAG: response regulator transcription factor [Aggregatilineales bacterium]
MIRVLIVDDQMVVTQGLRVILEGEDDISVVGIAHNGAQAVDMIEKVEPNLVLMDLKMPTMNGIHATRTIREQYPEIFVLVLTTYSADEWVFDAIRAGASGYLLKDSDGDDIIAAIKGTVEGKTHIDPAIADKLLLLARDTVVPDKNIFAELTDRERDMLRYLASGLTNREIGNKLSISDGTVRNNMSTILNKLGASDRTQAAALAWYHGLVNRADMSFSKDHEPPD